MNIKHEGFSPHRLSSNPLEALYAEEWEKVAEGTLGYLLYGQDRSQHNVKPKEAKIAATIIQWLGSPVGRYFVEDVLEKYRKAGK